MVVPVISIVGFSQKHVIKVEFFSSETDFHHKITHSTKIVTSTRMGPGVPGPNRGPKLSLMYIYIYINIYIYIQMENLSVDSVLH